MNTNQRVVLVIGVVALLVVLATTKTYQRGEYGMIMHSGASSGLANLWDWQTALARSGIVVVATAGLYLAFGNRKK